jgi:hypothetical protein
MCMCMCMCMCICVCACVCACVCVHVYAYVYVYVHVRVWVMYMHAYVFNDRPSKASLDIINTIMLCALERIIFITHCLNTEPSSMTSSQAWGRNHSKDIALLSPLPITCIAQEDTCKGSTGWFEGRSGRWMCDSIWGYVSPPGQIVFVLPCMSTYIAMIYIHTFP